MIHYKTDQEIELIRQSSLLVGKTLAEVAKKLGVSRERVRQIEEAALRKLRKFVVGQEKEI